MCGRYVRRTPLQNVVDLFSAVPAPAARDLKPSFNVAPTQQVAAVRMDDQDQRMIVSLKWGLIPPWASDPSVGNRMINARSETVAEKPAFRDAFRRRRCILPADGFYEWKRDGKQKQPFHIHRADQKPFGLAGLWERWSSGSDALYSCTILTTSPNDLMRTIHDRMPVILSEADYDTWLAPGSEPKDIATLMRPFPGDELVADPVSQHVNNPRNDDPRCLMPPETNGRL